MSGPSSLSIRLALVISVSFATASFSSSYSPSSLFAVKSNSSSSPKPPTPKATPSDLLSLLATAPNQASSAATVDPVVAKELSSCLKFLVPFSPTRLPPPESPALSLRRGLRSASSNAIGAPNSIEENELVWWPPAPVMELARLAVDSGGDPDAIHRALDPTIIPL